MSLHSTSRSSILRRATAQWGFALVPILVLAGFAAQAVAATEPPEGGGYCSTAAHEARRADIAFERGGPPPARSATDRHCQR